MSATTITTGNHGVACLAGGSLCINRIGRLVCAEDRHLRHHMHNLLFCHIRNVMGPHFTNLKTFGMAQCFRIFLIGPTGFKICESLKALCPRVTGIRIHSLQLGRSVWKQKPHCIIQFRLRMFLATLCCTTSRANVTIQLVCNSFWIRPRKTARLCA